MQMSTARHWNGRYEGLYESATDYNSERPFQPVTLQGALFADGVPLYREANLVKTPAQGNQLVEVMVKSARFSCADMALWWPDWTWKNFFSKLWCSKTTLAKRSR
jgi:hypothetical protein